jgi:hypothetical protein
MAEMMVTIRFETHKIVYEIRGKSYRVYCQGTAQYLPMGSTKVSTNGKFTDFDLPKWIAIQKGYENFIVSEYPGE